MIVLALLAVSSLENVVVDGVDIDVFTPSVVVKGDVLVLPGWDSTKTNWCEKQNGLCDQAERRGLRLVMPEMAKSVYADRVYPETSALFRKQLTRTQLEDAIVHLQHDKGLLANPSTTTCIGRSTGGRGCVLLALDHPEWFKAVASLSGDFDQTKMPTDGLMEGAYGTFAKFPERWSGSENPMKRVDEMYTPIYLGHGAKDRTVSPEQTHEFAELVQARHPNAVVVLEHIDPQGAHNHDYWKRELAPVFDFFDKAPDPIKVANDAFEQIAQLAQQHPLFAYEAGNASPAEVTIGARGATVIQRTRFVAVFHRDGASITCHAFHEDGWAVVMRGVPHRQSNGETTIELRVVSSEGGRAPLAGVQLVDGWRQLWRFLDGEGHEQPVKIEVHAPFQIK